jgi:hypothetical protein
MKEFKWWEKALFILLVPCFIVSFFLISVTSITQTQDNAVFLAVGSVIAAINIGIFFFFLKTLKKYFDFRHKYGIKLFFYTIIVMPLVVGVYAMGYYQAWLYMAIYVVIAGIYVYLINKEFGVFSFKIDQRTNQIYIHNLKSYNTDLRIVGKDKKVKSSTDELRVGDAIIVRKDGETILTLNVAKNKK